jgi:hypothetical protein
MSFRQSKSRKHVPLPIAGHTLVEIGTSYLISLTFASPIGLLSELRLEFEVILAKPGGSAEAVTATRPGPTFDRDAAYESLSPLLDRVVKAAVAHSNGDLDLTFYEDYRLQVHPENFEAWHFKQPAPSIKSAHHVQQFSVTGYGGGLITFGAT